MYCDFGTRLTHARFSYTYVFEKPCGFRLFTRKLSGFAIPDGGRSRLKNRAARSKIGRGEKATSPYSSHRTAIWRQPAGRATGDDVCEGHPRSADGAISTVGDDARGGPRPGCGDGGGTRPPGSGGGGLRNSCCSAAGCSRAIIT